MNKDFRAPADSIILKKLQKKAQADQRAMLSDLIGRMTHNPSTWEDADHMDINTLRPEAKEFVKGLSVFPIDVKEPLDNLYEVEPAKQWFVVQHRGQYYLVDFDADFHRYVLCLDNFSGQNIKVEAQEVVPGLDEMIADEKAAPADYRMLVKELEKIGELDAAKRLQKKIIEDEKGHFKYLKELKQELKEKGEEETANTIEAILKTAKSWSWKGYKAYKEGNRERGGCAGYKGKTYYKKTKAQEEPLEVIDVPLDADGRKLEVGDTVETIGNSMFHIPVGAQCKILGLQLHQFDEPQWLALTDLGEFGNIIPTHGLKKVTSDTEAVEDKRNKDKNNIVTTSDTGSHNGLEEGKMGERGTLIPENPTREFKLAKTIAARLKKGQEGTVKDDFITRGFYPKVKDTTKVKIPGEDKKFKWIITEDQIWNGDIDHTTSRVGTGNVKSPDGLTFKFRLIDDDGELYYVGVCNGWDFDEEQVFAPLDWASNYAGATTLWYLEEGQWKQL